MARIRTIKPEFWTDSLMVQLPHLTRLIYIALWNQADDHGFIRDEPERMAMEVMPRESPLDVDSAIQLLTAIGRLELFADPETAHTYLKVAHWEDHQKVDHPAKSRISREGSRKVAIPNEVRRALAQKYGCPAGEVVAAECYYCGAAGQVHGFRNKDGRPSAWVVFPGLEMDHIHPEASGGKFSIENIVLSCRHCNRSKGTKHWIDFFTSINSAILRELSRGFALERNREQGKEQEEKSTAGQAPPQGDLLGAAPARAPAAPPPVTPPPDPPHPTAREALAEELGEGVLKIPAAQLGDAVKLWRHWQATMKHPRAKLDRPRAVAICKAMESYGLDYLTQAVTGCSWTPHNMGQNERQEVYDDITLILRDNAHIDRFARRGGGPPPGDDPTANMSLAGRSTAQAAQRWLDREETHG